VSVSPASIAITNTSVAFVKFTLVNPNTFPIFIDNWKIEEKGKVVIQENHYDPYGFELYGLDKKGNPEHDYQYNGKEHLTELGLEWDDYGARTRDRQLNIWWQVDPLAEKYYSISPYVYVVNNPILHTDPDGRSVDGEYELDANGNFQKVSDKGDDIGVDFYHFDNVLGDDGKTIQKTWITDRKGNWNWMKNGRYNLQGDVRDGETNWSTIYEEFRDGTGSERSFFEGEHTAIQDIKDNYLFEKAFTKFEKTGRDKAPIEANFSPLDIITTGTNMQVQMMGSYNVSFYKLGDKVLSLVQDSKSRTSLYYHLPVTNYSRNETQYMTIPGGVTYYGKFENLVIPHKKESSTYQTYLFFK
jgi:RHS repeat-associated protein